jgi:hypothetical protein
MDHPKSSFTEVDLDNSVTHEDERAEYVRLMGADLGLLFHELKIEEEWLRDKWAVFQELFDKDPERIVLLNRMAPNFFYFLKKLLYEDTMLHLSRLTDPREAKIRNEIWPNLTVRGLAHLISDQSLKTQVEAATDRLTDSCKFARDRRNRQLVHTDLKTSRNEHPNILPTVQSAASPAIDTFSD